MSLKQKTITLNNNSYVLSNSNAFFNYFDYFQIAPFWQLNYNNKTWIGTDEDAGTNTLGDLSVQTDGDLVLSVGWYDGFGIHRLEDDGSLSLVYHDHKPNDVYNYYHSLAINTNEKVAFAGTHGSDGIVKYDYSDLANVTKTVYKESNSNIPADRCGQAYYNGLFVIGDYLYIGAYDHTYSQVFRWNWKTDTMENINVDGFRYAGRYATFRYDSATNRLYVLNRDNGEIWLVQNPDQANATATLINIESIGVGNDVRTFMLVPDKNDHDVLMIASEYGRFIKIRITDIVAGTTHVPTVVKQHPFRSTYRNYKGMYEHVEWNLRWHEHPTLKSDLIIAPPHGDHAMANVWFDQENFIIVGLHRYYFDGYDNRDPSNPRVKVPSGALINSYGPMFQKATSAGGHSYWIRGAYGWNWGYKFITWDANTFPNGLTLSQNSEITLGQFKFDDNANIGGIKIAGLKDRVYQLADTNVSIDVTNNNGSTWENYDFNSDEIHYFSSTGNSVQIRIRFTNPEHKSAHITAPVPPTIILFDDNPVVTGGVRAKYARLKIKGV